MRIFISRTQMYLTSIEVSWYGISGAQPPCDSWHVLVLLSVSVSLLCHQQLLEQAMSSFSDTLKDMVLIITLF